ncbi:MAG TPA: YceH family protein [Candidatus Sulfotelmatobacter sp.]|nr:YceH family protein [Candidatus Sulfotelmatobacter sp.]
MRLLGYLREGEDFDFVESTPTRCIKITRDGPVNLTAIETRVLGALIEKDITTPDYYPLSLNALVNACNQKNNRDPVMTLDEESVRQALATLQEKRLAGPASGADSRVTKFEHRLQEVFNFDRREIAVVCVLLLRGPQTPGELRSRTERMYHFEALDDIVSTLDRLGQREPPLARVLPRQPGTKESRYAHLFSGEIPEAAPLGQTAAASSDRPGSVGDRLMSLEEEVARLRQELADVQQQLAVFRRQFE